jgi:hypothetical protein
MYSILVSLLLIDAATNCDQSHKNLRSLNSCFRLVRFTREIWETLPLHDKIRPHSNMSTTEDIVSAHCLNPVFILLYIHLSGPLKDSPQGQHCIVDVALQNAFRPWLQRKKATLPGGDTCFCSKVKEFQRIWSSYWNRSGTSANCIEILWHFQMCNFHIGWTNKHETLLCDQTYCITHTSSLYTYKSSIKGKRQERLISAYITQLSSWHENKRCF